MVLKSDKSFVVQFRTSQIKLLQPFTFSFMDYLPEEAWHRPQIMKSRIGTSVLVNERLLMAQRENARDRPTVNPRHMDCCARPQTLKDIAKPGQGLWRQSMTTPC